MSVASDNSEDDFLNEIKQSVNKIIENVQKSKNEYKNDLERMHSHDLAMKDRLISFAKECKLDKALVDVWDEIQSYPGQCKNDNSANKLSLDSIVEADETKNNSQDEKLDEICFTWSHIPFKIISKESTCWLSPEPFSTLTISLFEQGELVFKVTDYIDHNDFDYCLTSSSSFSVEAFKKKGSWARFLLISWEILQVERARWETKHSYSGAKNIKDNFQD